MKHASNPRRGRGRNSGKRNQGSRNRNFENNGSDSKVRGSAQQVLDRYQALARDAQSSGDRIAAEGYMQHVEHYYRILNPEGGQSGNQHERKHRDHNGGKRHDDAQDRSGSKSQASEQPESAHEQKNTAPEKPVEAVTEAALEPSQGSPAVEEAVEEKPKRRGRPRKAASAKPATEGDNASETAA